MIEGHEKVAGFVKQDEIDHLLSRHPKLKAVWSSATSAQIRDLNALVRVAADDETAQAGTYICELEWSSLEGNTDNSSLKYNIEVK